MFQAIGYITWEEVDNNHQLAVYQEVGSTRGEGGSDNHLPEDTYRQEVVDRQHPLGEDRYQQGEGMFPQGEGILQQEEGIVHQQGESRPGVGGDARALLKGPLLLPNSAISHSCCIVVGPNSIIIIFLRPSAPRFNTTEINNMDIDEVNKYITDVLHR